MLTKIHSHGSGSGHSVINYLLGAKRDRELATTLRGDPENAILLIDSLDFKSRYTSGVLSFTEDDTAKITPQNKDEIMDLFEQSMFPNLEKGEYDIVWIEHLDKGRLELNFVIPKVHLPTGKQLNVYSHRADLPLIDAFKRLTNLKYDLDEPAAASRKRTTVVGRFNDMTRKDIKTSIDSMLHEFADSGLINSRDDVIEHLKNAGLNIVKESEWAVYIANPSKPELRPIPLKGAFFETRFSGTSHRELQEQRDDASRGDRPQLSREAKQANRRLYEETEKSLAKAVRRRAESLEKRYKIEGSRSREGYVDVPGLHPGLLPDSGFNPGDSIKPKEVTDHEQRQSVLQRGFAASSARLRDRVRSATARAGGFLENAGRRARQTIEGLFRSDRPARKNLGSALEELRESIDGLRDPSQPTRSQEHYRRQPQHRGAALPRARSTQSPRNQQAHEQSM